MSGALPFHFEYSTQVLAESFGKGPLARSLQVECLLSLDQTIDDLFAALQRYYPEKIPEGLFDSLCPYFGQIWPAARGLAEKIMEIESHEPWAGKRVLELGCGLGIPSLLLAQLGASVVATDFHPAVPQFLDKNCRRNKIESPSALQYRHCDWQNEMTRLGDFDWIIGSDILYERTHPEWVAKAIARQLSRHPQSGKPTQVLLADPGRPYLQSFVDSFQSESKMACETFVERVSTGHLVKCEKQENQPKTKDVFVLQFC